MKIILENDLNWTDKSDTVNKVFHLAINVKFIQGSTEPMLGFYVYLLPHIWRPFFFLFSRKFCPYLNSFSAMGPSMNHVGNFSGFLTPLPP